ncbi:DUF4350 domain-containing protein [Paractinoplanes ferrugineus]|uniref:DUF4350 domain-containing protein n=1 Tax=Paractinoplanes ferrugineus TaxID=113564 RepID=A0A919MKN7_9ACTN|nr:DUF4350 domain-containing protein [Actinoplanes ferrugineus]GIE11372.1 hypothetical protein Afe05nite_32120 [Actinoplanes ferrugineus]
MRSRRWLRAAVPFAALLALITGTLIVHAIESPDPGDDAYLSPVSDAGIGSATLAGRLRGQGVTVTRVTSSDDALTALRGGSGTLLVTTPGLVDTDKLDSVPAGTRIVLVAPDRAALTRSDWPIAVRSDRWAPATADPGCADATATAAGPAAVRDLTYMPDDGSCYDGALITVASGAATVTVVGAADPFRNDRIAEHGNAALATGLLSATKQLVWLDVHEREKPPAPPSRPPTTRPTLPPQQDGGGRSDAGRANPLADAFPAALWATLALLALALLALAGAAARRLGTPVPEPLPSRVPAFETVLGHARLYQRAGARGESLDLLRAAATRRIADHLGLPPGAGVDDIAAATGYPSADIYQILGPGHPDDDDELVAAAAAVQALERAIKGEQP